MTIVSYYVGGVSLKWRIDLVTTRISSLTKETVRVNVSADAAGLIYNPTVATVELAAMPSGDNPGASDWKAGVWNTTVIGSYSAAIIIGPGQPLSLVPGEYYLWLRITDASSGETVVRQSGVLIVE